MMAANSYSSGTPSPMSFDRRSSLAIMPPSACRRVEAIAEVDENVHIPIDTTFVLAKSARGDLIRSKDAEFS